MCFCEIRPYKVSPHTHTHTHTRTHARMHARTHAHAHTRTHTHSLQEMESKANSSECRCEMQILWFSLQCFSWRLALWMNRSVCFWLRLEPVSSFSPLVALRNDFLLLKKLTVIPRAGSRFGTSAGGGRRVAQIPLVQPFVQAASAGVHEEVADSVQFQTQLLWDGQLHLFGRTLVLLKDGQKCSPLQVCETQPRFLWCIASVFARVQLFSFARFGGFVC